MRCSLHSVGNAGARLTRVPAVDSWRSVAGREDDLHRRVRTCGAPSGIKERKRLLREERYGGRGALNFTHGVVGTSQSQGTAPSDLQHSHLPLSRSNACGGWATSGGRAALSSACGPTLFFYSRCEQTRPSTSCQGRVGGWCWLWDHAFIYLLWRARRCLLPAHCACGRGIR